jgi:BirA family biotin operon repressor/biotin-[acetyl-CoA-carboxylase] ligase
MAEQNFDEIELAGYAVARRYGVVSSTMDVARDLLSGSGDSSWSAVVVADRQLAGRGRQGRSWLSGEGAFMATFAFPVAGGVAALSGYSLAVGVALAEVLGSVGAHIQLKWPNDLVVCTSGRVRKLGGILIEVQEVFGRRYVLVGIGLNVEFLPAEVADIAVSVTELRSLPLTSADLLTPVAVGLSAMHEEFIHAGGLQPFLSRWRSLCCFRAGVSSVSVDLGQEVVEGVYQDVHTSGALVLQAQGHERLIHSGHLVRFEV